MQVMGGTYVFRSKNYLGFRLFSFNENNIYTK